MMMTYTALRPNDLGIKSISFNFESVPHVITIGDEKGEHSFKVGYQAMETGSMAIGRLVSTKIAASGAWSSAGQYRVRIIYFETPHEITCTFRFEDEKMVWDTKMNVSLGSTEPEQLIGDLR
jgi:hypothetical protein